MIYYVFPYSTANIYLTQCQTVWVDGMLLVKFFSADFYYSTRELGHWWWQASTDPPCWSRWLLSTSKFETFKLKWMGFCNVGWINPCCPDCWPQTTQSYRPRSTIFFSNHISGSGGWMAAVIFRNIISTRPTCFCKLSFCYDCILLLLQIEKWAYIMSFCKNLMR